jgi:hypothetical protein
MKCFFKLEKINLFVPNFTVEWHELDSQRNGLLGLTDCFTNQTVMENN